MGNTNGNVAFSSPVTITVSGGEDIVIPKGDLNGDQSVDLEDALIALKIMCGTDPGIAVKIENEVNNDGKIGAEEVIYALRKAAGL